MKVLHSWIWVIRNTLICYCWKNLAYGMPKIYLFFQCTQLKTAGKREKAFSVVQDQPTVAILYEDCVESIQPFWISRESVAWPWCNLVAIQSAVRCHWLSLCTVWPSHSQFSSLPMVNLALGKARSRREPNLGCRGRWQAWAMWCFAKKACMRAVEWQGSWSVCSVIVNATVTQYTNSVSGISLPTD